MRLAKDCADKIYIANDKAQVNQTACAFCMSTIEFPQKNFMKQVLKLHEIFLRDKITSRKL
ncbi:MAG: hypothetical protein IJL14_02815 [Selenomonadaceae bacterium]|nr:hypothetical protein [Selenomonadaceae bacterium]